MLLLGLTFFLHTLHYLYQEFDHWSDIAWTASYFIIQIRPLIHDLLAWSYHLISIVPRAKWIDPTSPENVVEERGSLDLAVRSEVACQHAQILVVSPEPRARGREVSQIANSNTLSIFTQYWLVVACTFVTNSFGNAVSYLLSSLPYLNWLRSGF